MTGKTINDNSTNWDVTIGPKGNNLSVDFKELWRFRDLMMMFIKKDIITVYKQTVLGPVWFVIQPVFTTIIYLLVFGRIANIGTDGVPVILFYMGSVTLWNYFSETMNVTSKTFIDHAFIFGKVYFPRIVVPISKVFSGLIKFFIQFALFFIAWLYYAVVKKTVSPNIYILLFPVIVATLSLMSLGFGLFITSMTTKYRDLVFLISFGVQLLMYATPIIYPLSKIAPKYQVWLWINPLTALFETFKYGFFGKGGILSIPWLLYSIGFTLVLMTMGIIVFNKVEKRFIDTV